MDESYGAEYEQLYRAHWWWRAREAILVRVLRRLRPQPGSTILDVGCGNALSFPALAEFGTVRGIEVDVKLLDDTGPFREQISTDPLESAVYDDPRWRFDVITALDVVEHIDDDGAAVARMVGMLKCGGFMIITVPAFPLLWDHHDEINLHRRRYTAASVKRILGGQGVELLELRYLFRSLFIPKLGVCLWNAGRARKVAQHGMPGAMINVALERLCILEDRLLGRWPLPFGTSVLAVARKPEVVR
jgi:cyclopropane fatty-acyl-phospholipid synthase-like methyltransferase